jgi:hypothetical protein
MKSLKKSSSGEPSGACGGGWFAAGRRRSVCEVEMLTTIGSKCSARSAYPCGLAATAGDTATEGAPGLAAAAGAGAGTAAAFTTGAGAAVTLNAPLPSEASTSAEANVAKRDRAPKRETEAMGMKRSFIVVTTPAGTPNPKQALRISLAAVLERGGKIRVYFPLVAPFRPT